MTTTSIHNLDRYTADLRRILPQGRKRIGSLLGASGSSAIRVDDGKAVGSRGNVGK